VAVEATNFIVERVRKAHVMKMILLNTFTAEHWRNFVKSCKLKHLGKKELIKRLFPLKDKDLFDRRVKKNFNSSFK